MEYNERKVPQINSLDQLVEELRKIFAENDVDVDFVQDVMSAYKSDPKEWRQFAHFDRHRYTRNLVDNGNGKYNLMLIAWSEGQGTGIHDHANAHCFMKVLAGSLTEIRFEWPEAEPSEKDDDVREMKVAGENDLGVNEVTYINDTLGLHRMENRSHAQPAVSLHLYVPPFESCRTFDQRTGHSSRCQVTFHSKLGKRTPFGMPSRRGNTSEIIHYENN